MHMQAFPDFGSTLHGELEIFRQEISSREETHRREILELSRQIEASLHLFQQQQQPPSQSETDARLDKLTEAVQALSLGREPRRSDTGAKIDALQTAIQGLKAPQDGGGRRHSESNDRRGLSGCVNQGSAAVGQGFAAVQGMRCCLGGRMTCQRCRFLS